MISKWSEYSHINENLQRARAILRRNGIEENNVEFQKLRKLLTTKPGYLGKFTEWLFIDKITYQRLESLFNDIKDINLPKAIGEFKTPEEIIDTIIRTNADTAINQMVNAIPSRTRLALKFGPYCEECGDRDDLKISEVDCDDCGGSGEIDCDDCDGDGEIECDDCEGADEIECDKCEGSGETKSGKECKACKGSGNIECKSCKGKGGTTCKKCKGEGKSACKECEGEGTKECQTCKKEYEEGTEDWKDLLKFLTLHADKKEIIVDFLSKKSGRYKDDIEYDGYEEVFDIIKNDINSLLNIQSIDSIYENTKTDKDIKLIHNDDKVLIIAVNYKGIVKYGSSYWCIKQNESTFDDYVYDNDNTNQQWILYFKDTRPLIDDRSMMGITYNINGSVNAAHWEDDSECVSEADNIIKTLDINPSNIIDALSIYSHEDINLFNVYFTYPEHFKPKIIDLLKSSKKALDKKQEILKSIGNKRASRETSNTLLNLDNYIYNISRLIYEIGQDDSTYINKVSNLLKQVSKETGILIPIEDVGLGYILNFNDLYKYIDIDLNDINLFEVLDEENIDIKKSAEIIKHFISKGYNYKRFIDESSIEGGCSEKYLLLLYNLDLIKIEDLLNLTDFNEEDLPNKALIEILGKDIKVDRSIYIAIIDYISKDSKLVSKYKDKILADINGGINLNRSDYDYILDKIDDDDIELACARKLIHKKILSKYDVDMKRRMLEHITFESFIKKFNN
jgi:hypothetical protein